MQALNARSKSVPFLEQPPALDGTLPGDVGFDPLGLSSAYPDLDWSELVVPNFWPDATPRTKKVTTIEWLRDAEVKHSRYAMLAVAGWATVEGGVRIPGFESIPNSLAAHDLAVANGSMGLLLALVIVAELTSGAAIYEQAKGSGRKSGEFGFDPLGLGKDPKKFARYATSEVKNGRLAMLAISGLLTQAALFPDRPFPQF